MQVALTSYTPGAEVVTALVGTAPEVRRRGEALTDPAALREFLDAHGVATASPPTTADVAAVRALRTALRELLDAPHDAAAGASALLARAGTPPWLARVGERWEWRVGARQGAGPADELAVLTATAVLAVIHALGHDRLRQCAAPDCAGAFVDSSRGGRRRYCVPEVCGNRTNVANHRARLVARD